MSLEQSGSWLARRWPVVVVAALVLGAAGGAAYIKLRRASAGHPPELAQLPPDAVNVRTLGGEGLTPVSAGLAGRAPRVPLKASRGSFDEACLRPIRLKRFAEAIEGCGRFVDTREHAGHAHAALAAIYATRSYIDVAASVHHAQMAAAAGDGRGKFMVAFHALTGQSGQSLDIERTRALLSEAKASGVGKAQQYIDIIDESKRCREQASFKLFEQPVFCYFRPELTQLLLSKGMTERQKDLEQWVDVYRPGDVLSSADRAEVVYDRDPKEELHRLARFVYSFSPKEGVDREAMLRRVLIEKYGEPQPMVGSKQTGGSSEWRLADGVQISLAKDADGNVLIRYTLPSRWEMREAHLKRERELEQNAQMLREQAAL